MEGVGNLMENWPYFSNGEKYGQGYYYSLLESDIRPFR